MTDHADPLTGAALSSFRTRDQIRAFRAATRHSARVRVLRFAMMGGTLALVAGIVLFTVFDPFHRGGSGIAIDGASFSGTKVTMASPRLSGYHKDGRPYTITASSALQDIKTPTVFELRDLQAQLTQTDRSVTKVTAATGVYDSASETMNLTSAVRIVGGNGLDVQAQDARVAFKSNSMLTDKPVTVAMGSDTVAADRMEVVDGGQHVTFEGNVHSVMTPRGGEAAAGRGAVPDQAGGPP